MFKYYITIAILCCTTWQVYSSNARDIDKALESFFTRRCNANGGKGAFDELVKAWQIMWGCFHNTYFKLLKATSEEEAFNLFCNFARNDIHSCLGSAGEKIEACLNKEEKFITNFASEWFNITFDEHCEDGFETVKDHEHLLYNMNCQQKSEEHHKDVAEDCFTESTIIKDLQSPEFAFTKSGLCGYLLHANECLLHYLKDVCEEKVYKFAEYHLRPTKIWCVKHINDVDH